jgi:hypothetical protein
MNTKLHLFILVLSAILIYPFTGSAQTSERTKILLACERVFGPPVDKTQNLFALNRDFVLQAKVDGRGSLTEFAVKPKYFFNETHPEWEEPRSFPLISPEEFKILVSRLDALRPKGKLTKPANAFSVITNSTGYFTESYQRALLQWGEVGIRGDAGNGVRFFTVRYFGRRTRPRK